MISRTPDQPLVSVIVPVFRVEKYLRQCVESVLAQSYCHWEMILVDDGSDDSSPMICDEYAASDSRIRVLHKENGGPSSARNSGLEIAKGDFMIFVDSDDIVAPHFIESLLPPLLSDNRIDIALCGFYEGISSAVRWKPAEKFTISDNYVTLRNTLYQYDNPLLYNNSFSGKLFRRKLFDGLHFTNGIIYEDLEFYCRLMLKADKVAATPTKLYFYRKTPGSIMNTFSSRRYDVLTITDRIVDAMRRNCPELVGAALSRKFSAYFNIYCLLKSNKTNDQEMEEKCWAEIRRLRLGRLFDPRVRIKNKIGALLSLATGRTLVNFLAPRIYRSPF